MMQAETSSLGTLYAKQRSSKLRIINQRSDMISYALILG